MKNKSRPFDFAIRLPKAKKYLREEMMKIAEENGMTLTQLMTLIVERFLKERKKKEIAFKIK